MCGRPLRCKGYISLMSIVAGSGHRQQQPVDFLCLERQAEYGELDEFVLKLFLFADARLQRVDEYLPYGNIGLYEIATDKGG